jgi:O-antigen/teichoic acid export membrane protein
MKKRNIKESLTNQVLKNSFWNFLMVLLSKIGGLVFMILLARFLLPERFGVYNLTMSIAIILLTFADIGINQTLIRYFSEAFGKKNKKFAMSVYKYLFKLKFFLTLAFALFLIVFSYSLSMHVFKKPLLFLPLIFSGVYLFIYSFESFYESFFYVVKKVRYLTLKQILFETARIVGSLFVFILIASQYQVIGVIGVMILAMSFALIFLLYHLNRTIPFLFKTSEKNLEKEDKKRINKFLIYLIIGSTLIAIFGYVDIIMIGLFLTSEFVGFYSASLALACGLAAVYSIANVLLPVFTQLKKEKINEAFNKVFKYTALITIPSIFGIFVLGNYIIRLIYGYEYLPATLPLYFLALLMLEIPVTNAIKSLFTAKEKPKYFVNILIIATIMNIILNYILITSFLKISANWAIAGAALATLTSRYFYFFGLSFYAKKELNVSLKIMHLIKPVFSAIIMASVLFWINSKISDMTLIIGALEIALGVLIYFSVMFLIKGVKKQDFFLIKHLLS